VAEKRRRPAGRNADPDANWGEEKDSGDWREAAKYAGEIWQKIEDAPGDVWDKAFEFFEDVQEKVLSVQETIQKNQRVSEKQLNALKNWEKGVDNWLEKE
jgi:hypothetical protein